MRKNKKEFYKVYLKKYALNKWLGNYVRKIHSAGHFINGLRIKFNS